MNEIQFKRCEIEEAGQDKTFQPPWLQWGYKFVGADLCTDDHNGGRFRYRLGEWHEATNPTEHNNPCPTHPGDGLCVARTLSGAQSGGLQLDDAVMLLVAFTAADVLADTVDKVRVARLWVHPDPVDPLQAIIGHGANLSGAILNGASLSRADLDGASLNGASLDGANLNGASLSRADLDGANLNGASLDGANLSGANLYRADLSGANLYGANLSGANLDGASLSRADLDGAILSGADLYGANLNGASLSRADLDGADLSRANLSRADLYRANLSGARGDRYTVLPAGWMVRANGFVVQS